jgi:hypothetical protein
VSEGMFAMVFTVALIVVHSAAVSQTFSLVAMVASSIPGATYLKPLLRFDGLTRGCRQSQHLVMFL